MKNVIVTGLNLFAGKGQPGTPIERIQCITEELKGGIEGDCHYGEGEKQVSITSEEILKWMQEQETEGLCFAKYNANIVVKGSEGQLWSVGEKIVFGEAVLKITGRGKKCFNECRRHAAGMDCRLRDGCCYAKVVKAGEVRIGDMVNDAAQAEPYRWNRYARQMTAQMHGREGQQKLRQGSVLVVGAGGLGSRRR